MSSNVLAFTPLKGECRINPYLAKLSLPGPQRNLAFVSHAEWNEEHLRALCEKLRKDTGLRILSLVTEPLEGEEGTLLRERIVSIAEALGYHVGFRAFREKKLLINKGITLLYTQVTFARLA